MPRLRALLAGIATAGAVLVPLGTPSPAAGAPLTSPVVAVAATTTGGGHWLATAGGGVYSSGDAGFAGSMAGRPLSAPIVGMAADPDGAGYWLVASDGGVFSFDAPFFGSQGGRPLNAPVVGMAAAPGGGYWLVASDGGVFSFGPGARFSGSRGGQPLNRPVVGMAAEPGGDGYWLVASDGGIFSFAAPFAGSTGGSPLNAPVNGMAADPDGDGYWLVAADGGVFSFRAPFAGSRGGAERPAPVAAMAARAGGGYWLGEQGGRVHAFGGAPALGGYGEPVLSVAEVRGGLDIPWDVDLASDGTLFYTERPGRLWARAGGVDRLLAAPPDVFANSEGGMLGLAVDPDFASNRRIYVCQSWTDGVRRDVRLHAWEVAPDAASATRVVQPLVSGLPAGSGRHNGCRPEIGPDGFLWVGTGDAATCASAQDLANLGGKVLRVDRFSGAPAPGNPFGTAVWTFGHRNVQGLAFAPGSGQPFAVEHGPRADDEVTALRPGGNGGWAAGCPYVESVPMTDLRRFPEAMVPSWRSGPSTIATSGAAFLTGRQWQSWRGGLAIGVLKGAQLRVLFLDPGGRLLGERVVLGDYGRLRSVTSAPDGSLYVTTSNGGGRDRILRVTAG